MSTEVIREFLVSLGFKVDSSGQRQFVDGIEDATKKVVALGSAALASSTAMIAGLARMASGLEELYYLSQRTHASSENILAFGFAASTAGGSVEGARASLEALARFMRENPGGEGLVKSLGVQTREANGELRDTTVIMRDMGRRMAAMPYYRARQYGNLFGFDERTLMALRKGIDGAGQEYSQMLRVAGLNADTAASSSRDFMNALRGATAWIRILALKVTSELTGSAGDQVQRFRQMFIANFDRIGKIIATVIRLVLSFADITSQISARAIEAVRWIMDRFDGLDQGTKDLIESIALLAAGWWALNKVMALSPVGLVLALAAAVLALWDDFRTWKEGGKSLIDWGAWGPELRLAQAGFKLLGDGISNAVQVFRALADAIRDAFEWLGRLADKISQSPALRWVIDKTQPARDWVQKQAGAVSDWVFSKQPQTRTDVSDLMDAARGVADKWQGRPYKRLERDGADGQGSPNPDAKKLFDGLENKYNLPPGMLDSVWKTESGRGTNMQSPAGAQGHFGFMPATAKAYGLHDPNNLVESADAAARMYADLIKQYGGNVTKALAAYNWGSGNLDRQGLDAAPKETRDYIRKIESMLGAQGRPLDLDTVMQRSKQMDVTMLRDTPAPRGSANTPDKTISMNTENNITVYGSDKPKETANMIAERQNAVNERATRNLKLGLLS